MRRLREDVHIHASPADVYGHLFCLDGARAWLPPAFSDVDAGANALSFALALPMRTERARLAVASEEPPTYLEFTAADGPGGIELLAWALNPEGARDVHVTVEAGYQPAGGALGWLLESAVHRPLRRQAFRDALWRLKLLVEGRR